MASWAAGAEDLPGAIAEAASGEQVERGLERNAPAPPGCRTLFNQTYRRLEITDAFGTIVIPSLGCRRIEADRAEALDLAPLIDAGFLSVVRDSVQPRMGAEATAILALPMVALAVGVLAGAHPLVLGLAVAAASTAGAAIAVRETSTRRAVLDRLAQARLKIKDLLNLGLALSIVAVLPGAILFFGSDVPHLWTLAREGATRETRNGATSILIGVGLQWIFIVFASALPALLYFLFDREKLRTLRERFRRQIFRLDPTVTTLGDVEAKYGKLLDEAYGREQATERLLPGRRFPIVLATAVITLGWVVTLLEPHLAEKVARTSLVSLFTPVPRAVAYGFLGAYFFTLHHLLRGFMRGDLRPKSYAHVAVRVLSTAVLAFVLSKALAVAHGGPNQADEAVLLVLAFMAGVLPETTLLRIQELTRGFAKSRRRLPSIYETHPLTQLEGIDIYDRARLTDEGVTNVEALAHHDLVDLLLKTRIPVPRVIDWVDQAILYVHVGGSAADDSPRATLDWLRQYGIRTATDLEEASRSAHRRGRGDDFLAILPNPKGAPTDPPRIRVILDAIADEEWMHNLRNWHREPKLLTPIRYRSDLVADVAT